MANNWWENDPEVGTQEQEPAATPSENFWENDPEVGDQPTDGQNIDPYESLDQERETFKDVTAERANRPDQGRNDGLRSYSDLYGDTQEKYSDLPTGNHPFDKYQMSETNQNRQVLRDTEMWDQYNRTGREKTVMGVPVRVQVSRENNPNYNPALPESEENNPFTEKEYLVDRPDSTTMRRVAQQVMENIGGGIADFVLERKLTEEGSVGKAIPDVVPDSGGEAIATELTTFVLGPNVVGGLVKGAGKGVGQATGLAAKIAKDLNPEDFQAVQSMYSNVLKATGSAKKAFDASNGLTKRLIVGAALGAGYGTAEAIVAPDGSEGYAFSPDTVKSVMPGISDERARDISFVLDTPVIGAAVKSVGFLYQGAKERFVGPAIGGIRNFDPFGGVVSKTANKYTPMLRITDEEAGLRVLNWLDPNLTNATAKEFSFRVNTFAGAIERKAVKNLQVLDAKGSVNLDTPAAFVDGARDYFEMAYGHLEEVLGPKEFNDWISQQSGEMAQKLYELKSSVVSDPAIASQTARASNTLESLFREGADSTPSGTLNEVQTEAGEVLGGEQLRRNQEIKTMRKDAKESLETADAARQTAISDDPELKGLFDEYVNTAGSTAEIEARLRDTVGGPLYNSFKKMKTDVDAAYKKVADSDAIGDVDSLRGVIGEEAASQPFFKKLLADAEKDPSFGNLYNNIRQDISDEIKRTDPQDSKMKILLAARKNLSEDQLDHLRFTGEGQTALDVAKAKEEYVKLNSAWYDYKPLENLSEYGKERMIGESRPAAKDAPLQGVRDWNDQSVKTVLSGLDSVNQKNALEAFEYAAKAGGEDISKGIADYYTSKSLSNIAQRMASGEKQNVGDLLNGVKSSINLLDNMKSPLAEKFKKAQVNIQTIQNTYKDAEKAFAKSMEVVEELQNEAKNSVLKQFLTRDKKDVLSGSGVAGKIDTILNAKDSESQLMALLKEADALGPNGEVVKDALKASVVDNIRSKVFSNKPVGIADIDNDKLVQGYQAAESQIRKLFEPNSKNLHNLKVVFADSPEVIDELVKTVNTLQNVTKVTAKNDEILKQTIDKSLDPVHGTNTAIQFMFGVLNPTATRVKRLVGPAASMNLDNINEARHNIMKMMLTDPKAFADISKKISINVEDRAARYAAKALFARSIARMYMNESNVDEDMKNLR